MSFCWQRVQEDATQEVDAIARGGAGAVYVSSRELARMPRPRSPGEDAISKVGGGLKGWLRAPTQKVSKQKKKTGSDLYDDPLSKDVAPWEQTRVIIMYVYIHKYTYMNIHTYTYMHAYIYIYMYIYIHE